MASEKRVRRAFGEAKRMLGSQGIECSTTVADLRAWFKADTPFEDSTLDDVIGNPFIVVHELVEIDEVKKMGLKIGKNTIVDNLAKVDIAHSKAAKVELMMAFAHGDRDHITGRIPDIQSWIDDPTVTNSQKRGYRRLLENARQMERDLLDSKTSREGGRLSRSRGRVVAK